MALQKIYIGSVGPFLYEDTDPVNDVDGDFVGEDYHAIVTSGQMYVGTAPTNPNHVARYDDLISMRSPTFVDVTVSRILDIIYQNGDYLTFAQIVLRLTETPPLTTLAPTTLAPTTATATTPAPTTAAPTTAPPSDVRAIFFEGATNPPATITGMVAKDFGGTTYIELTLSVIIPPNHYFMLKEDRPYVEILRWIEYRMGV